MKKILLIFLLAYGTLQAQQNVLTPGGIIKAISSGITNTYTGRIATYLLTGGMGNKIRDSIQANVNLKFGLADSATAFNPYRLGMIANTAAITGKQATLVSNTNIKTVNGTSLLGSGDIAVAPLASPTFTGTPAAPTAATQNNTTQLATTAYVNNNYVFSAICTSNGFSPADATTYYFGTVSFVNSPVTTVNQKTFAVPTNCTLIGYSIVTNSGITTSTESSTVSVRINNTTDIQLSNAVAFNATANTQNYFTGMALATNMTAGDFYEIKWLTPTWTTNPTGAIMTVALYFRSR